MNDRAQKKTIFIVDDHPLIRRSLRLRLEQEPDMEVCGEAEDWSGALKGIARESPDLVILNISLNRYDGLELVESIKALKKEQKVVVLSMYEKDIFAERAIRAGAVAYVMKQERPEKVLDVIRGALFAGRPAEKSAGPAKSPAKRSWPVRRDARRKTADRRRGGKDSASFRAPDSPFG